MVQQQHSARTRICMNFGLKISVSSTTRAAELDGIPRRQGRAEQIRAGPALPLEPLLVLPEGLLDGADPLGPLLLGDAEHPRRRRVVAVATAGAAVNNLKRKRIPLHHLLLGRVPIDGHHDRPGWIENQHVGRGIGMGEPRYDEEGDVDLVSWHGGRAQRGPARLPAAGAKDVLAGSLLVDPALNEDGLDGVGGVRWVERSGEGGVLAIVVGAGRGGQRRRLLSFLLLLGCTNRCC